SDLGVEIQSATEPSADDGGFTRDLLFLLANRESRNTSARVKPIQKMKASDGRWQGRPPAGYDLVAGKLQPNAQAPLIAQLFELAATGNYSITKLRRWSHLKGLTSSTGKEPSRSL